MSSKPPQMSRVTLGFIPLLDCAALVAAAELGFAAREGLELRLVRETSWANIRDRTLIGHFDAAHMLGPMTVASTLGIGHLRTPLIAPCALGLGGNAITVSMALWEEMTAAGARLGAAPAVQGAALRAAIAERARRMREPLTFGMVYPFSCHNYELRYWLAAAGIRPDADVRLVVIPPPFLVDAMRAGEIDGFCVGEPWSSVAVDAGAGVIVCATTSIWPWSAEKVLGCRRDWAMSESPTLAALIRSIQRAAEWCDQPQSHAELAQRLSEPRYIGAPAELLRRALCGRLVLKAGEPPQAIENFFATARHAATFPWVSHALWFYSQMVRWGQVEPSDERTAAVRSAYRPDLFRAAVAPLGTETPALDSKCDVFFDGEPFHPDDLPGYIERQRRS